MVFSSQEFILIFLPLVLCLTFIVRRFSTVTATLNCITLSSFVFYGWWDWRYLPLLLLSIFGNWVVARLIADSSTHRKFWLTLGIVANLGLLAYFKYWNFFIDNLEAVTGADYNFANVILPIGISFFTFQQIAFLVDTSKDSTRRYTLPEFSVFVSFFPQLIAGPIVHHKDLIPQLTRGDVGRFNVQNMASGVVIFVVGLGKKVLIADSLAQYADPLYAAAGHGTSLSMFEAWGASLTYGLQLYFDFSGYANMAIGLGLMFGIILPENFDRPYASFSIQEFWRRWHMTLSRFLRDYLYVPLGGSRRGLTRQCINLMITMMLGGIWHGAGWVFFVWGALHGSYMVIECLGRAVISRLNISASTVKLFRPISWLVMMFAVFFAWVPFRAPDLAATQIIWSGMLSGPLFPASVSSFVPVSILELASSFGVVMDGPTIVPLREWMIAVPLIVLSLVLAVMLPNGRRIADGVFGNTDGGRLFRSPAIAGASSALLLVTALILLSYNPVFLYFQF